ncbi:sulfotransferase family protein [Candidatus Poriferisocius sp.]|uniref:sulfotransferase family protein n=1 Tax=Candidatus Poriferisocius sp. TaxID=3101276 RepID=UPI003B5CBF63
MPTANDLMAEAVEATGLDEFGEDSFREGLEVLVASLRDEARLNDRGNGFLYPRITGHLAQRLQVEDWYRRHPEIDDVTVEAPLFGLGLPRTGSTVLSFLLAQDPDIRYLRQWEAARPCPPPSTVEGDDPRIDPAAVERVGTRSHVPTADGAGPMECLELMNLNLRSPIFTAFAHVPSYADWLLHADLTTTYAYQRRVMKLLQWGEPARPWRLKCPAHIIWIDNLLATFPDARFVMTHRDPTDVMLSVCDVYADIISGFTDHPDRAAIGRLNVETWSIGMDRLLVARNTGIGDRFYDIDFRAAQADPFGQVEGLYEWLGEPVGEEFAANMRSWWEQNNENREPSPKRDPKDFDLDLDSIRPLFADYIEQAAVWIGRGSE